MKSSALMEPFIFEYSFLSPLGGILHSDFNLYALTKF